MTSLQAIQAAQSGFDQGNIPGGLIICALRSLSPEHSLEMAKLAVSTGKNLLFII
jgi:hypothetical protein